MKKLFLACAMLFGIMLIPSTASAQSCPGTPGGQDHSNGNSFSFYAWTMTGYCAESYVQAWVDAVSIPSCDISSFRDWFFCWGNGGSIAATARATGWGYCGTSQGRGYHRWRSGQYQDPITQELVWDEFDTTGNMTVEAESCQSEQECLANGGTWYSDHCEGANSPIIIATGKDQSYRLTSKADGVFFDLDNDGIAELMAWTRADSDVAFLAIDRNGNGNIDNGSELFGNYTVPGSTNGFAALAALQLQYSGVVRGEVTLGDPLYDKLLLWVDRNHDGVSQPSELQKFSEKFSTIGLSAKRHQRRDGHGNRFAYEGYVKERTKPGKNPTESGADNAKRHRFIFDVFFVN